MLASSSAFPVHERAKLRCLPGPVLPPPCPAADMLHTGCCRRGRRSRCPAAPPAPAGAPSMICMQVRGQRGAGALPPCQPASQPCCCAASKGGQPCLQQISWRFRIHLLLPCCVVHLHLCVCRLTCPLALTAFEPSPPTLTPISASPHCCSAPAQRGDRHRDPQLCAAPVAPLPARHPPDSLHLPPLRVTFCCCCFRCCVTAGLLLMRVPPLPLRPLCPAPSAPLCGCTSVWRQLCT